MCVLGEIPEIIRVNCLRHRITNFKFGMLQKIFSKYILVTMNVWKNYINDLVIYAYNFQVKIRHFMYFFTLMISMIYVHVHTNMLSCESRKKSQKRLIIDCISAL